MYVYGKSIFESATDAGRENEQKGRYHHLLSGMCQLFHENSVSADTEKDGENGRNILNLTVKTFAKILKICIILIFKQMNVFEYFLNLQECSQKVNKNCLCETFAKISLF
jgi:hypothetical protein